MMDLQISQDGFFLGPILDSPASRLEFPGTHCNLNSVAIVFELNIDPWRRFLNTLAVGEQMQISVPCTPAHAHHLTERNLLITKETAAKSEKTLLARRAKGQHDGVRFDHPLHHGTMLRYYCYFYHYQPVIVTVTRHRIGRCSGGARRRRTGGGEDARADPHRTDEIPRHEPLRLRCCSALLLLLRCCSIGQMELHGKRVRVSERQG